MEKNFNYSFTSWKKPNLNENLVDYLLWQKEYCPKTSLEHYQGFVSFKKKYTMGQAKQCFRDKTLHIEKSYGTVWENYDYCTKNQSYAGERHEYGLGFIKTGIEMFNDIFNLEPCHK